MKNLILILILVAAQVAFGQSHEGMKLVLECDPGDHVADMNRVQVWEATGSSLSHVDIVYPVKYEDKEMTRHVGATRKVDDSLGGPVKYIGYALQYRESLELSASYTSPIDEKTIFAALMHKYLDQNDDIQTEATPLTCNIVK